MDQWAWIWKRVLWWMWQYNLDLKTTDESSGNELETVSDNDSASKEKKL